MWGRAFIVAVPVLLIFLQPTALVGRQSLDEVLAQGQRLMRRGDFPSAERFFEAAAQQLGPADAPHVLLMQARAALADGDTDAAESILQSLFTYFPNSDQTPAAWLTLAQIRRAAGDCAGAVNALDAYSAAPGQLTLGPYPALQRAQCLGKIEDWPGELAAARTALSIEGGGPRLTQIELLERAAEGASKLGRRQDALDF